MIMKSALPLWRQILSEAVTDPKTLLEELQLGKEWLEPAKKAARLFPLRVPRGYIAKIKKGDPYDPLLRQILPLGEELKEVPGFISDPLLEKTASSFPGLLHKYKGRVLVIMTGACAIHCRYCFRRHFPYAEHALGGGEWKGVLSYLTRHKDVDEVILSGGDPLVLSDEKLNQKIEDIARIPHLKRLRIHTRLPVVIPSRITTECLQSIERCRLKVVMVFHVNHPKELDRAEKQAFLRLHRAGVVLFNQSVLLKGVNDTSEVLTRLCQKLFEWGVNPYYLHLLDRVQGAAHFEVAEEKAMALYRELCCRLPGYCVPKLVREDPALPFKRLMRVSNDIHPFGNF
ncbi:MAG: EF-P beta-lysylation protein EpmB [Gammaproteobacteria bacterium]|nr:EF-P beta-lysylation protein EpmB [Gammaproteobacteria bacterium]